MPSGLQSVGWRILQIRRAYRTLACLPFAHRNATVVRVCPPYNELAAR